MSRWVLPLFLVAGCGRSASDAPAPAASSAAAPASQLASQAAAAETAAAETAAGKVVAIEGHVTARRAADGAAERALALQAPVFGDDTVTTAADGSVGILLGHNGVTWTLESGKARRLDSTLAWKAPPGSATAGPLASGDPSATAAAGRHAEEEAANTAATATRNRQQKAGNSAKKSSSGSRSQDDELLRALDTTTGAKGAAGAEGSGGGLKVGAGGGGPGGGGGAGTGLGGLGARPSSPTGKVTLAVQAVDGGLDAAVARRVLQAHLGQARACYSRALASNPSTDGAISLNIAVDATGAVTNAAQTSDTTNTAGLAACLIASARSTQFPPGKSDSGSTIRATWTLAPN